MIVASAVIAGGVVCGCLAFAWALHVKPKLRQRYERKHSRSKGNARRVSS